MQLCMKLWMRLWVYLCMYKLIYLGQSYPNIISIITKLISSMDQLKQILTHKLKLLQTYRNRAPISPQQRQQITQILLKQKRKQNSRDVIESRLLQTLSSRRIEAPYRIQEFYGESLRMMRMYCEGFVYDGEGKEKGKQDMVDNIVGLYVEFFQKNDCGRRAEEIRNMVQKNLCERSMIIPTIFNWFAQWVRKTFKDFIKKTLSTNNDKKNENQSLIQSNKKNRSRKFMQQLNMQRASLQLIDSEIKLHKMREISLSGNRSKLLSPSKAQIKTTRNVSKSELLSFINNGQYSSMSKLGTSAIDNGCDRELIMPISTRELTDVGKQREKQKERSIYLNKDIFFSAFYQELAVYYKFYSGLGELDENYPRNFRKVDRREQINKNMSVLVKSFVRNQPNQIKNSIQSYYTAYKNKFGTAFDQQVQNIKAKIKRRAESVDIYKEPAISLSKKTNRSFDLSQEKKTMPARMQAEKKKIQLELPSLKPHPHSSNLHKPAQKLIFVHSQIPISRYSRQKDKSQGVSAELYKQLRQINSLFKKGHRKQSLEILDKDLFQVKSNSIKFKHRGGQKDEIGQLLDGHFEQNGIFRLPKICR